MSKDIWSHSHDWDLGYAKGHKDGYEQGKAEGRVKVLEDVHKAMAYKYHCKEDMCEVGMTCADCLKAYMNELYSDK